jgi:hypothetical protein
MYEVLKRGRAHSLSVEWATVDDFNFNSNLQNRCVFVIVFFPDNQYVYYIPKFPTHKEV